MVIIQKSTELYYFSLLRITLLLFLLFIENGVLTIDCFGLNPDQENINYCLNIWTKRDGLPQNTVMAILQSKNGYIWIGTEEGLVRFDGFKFRTFTGESIGINHNMFVSALCENDSGDILIGTRDDGIMIFRNGKLEKSKYFKEIKRLSINYMSKAKNGSYYLATNSGLFVLKEDIYKIYDNKNGLLNKYVNVLYVDEDNSLWLGTYGGGLSHFKGGKFTHYTSDNGLQDAVVTSITRIKNQGLLIGTSQGLALFKNDKLIILRGNSPLYNSMIFDIQEDKNGTIWIGTSKGLGYFKDNSLSNLVHRNELSNKIIKTIYEDSSGNVWIGIYSGGLACFRESRFFNYSTDNGLSNDIVMPIFEDSRGRIWIGTMGGGLNIIEKSGIRTITTNHGLASDKVLSFYEDSKGAIWIGTYNGLSKYKDGILRTYKLQDNFIRSITSDKNGKLWLATFNGLYFFEKGRFKRFYCTDGREIRLTICFTTDENGIWVGTSEGKIYFFKHNDKSTNYDTITVNEPIRSLYKDKDGILWIGTIGGIIRYKEGKLFHYSIKDGLFHNTIYTILEDDEGFLWMTCNKGVFKIKRKSLNEYAEGTINFLASISYDEADGMLSSECNGGIQPAGIKDRGGRLWFPTTKGVAVIDPSKIESNQRKIPILIEDVIVDNQSYSANSIIEFPRGSKNYEFHFTGISFIGTEKVRFRYKLENFDQDWVEAGNRRSAYYTNLNPGRYMFKVIARNGEGIWDYEGVSFQFYIKPYFYETSVFYILLSALVIGLVSFLYSFRIYRLRKLKENLATTVDERTSELKELNIKLAKANKTLADLASKDGLTGVYNRRHFAKLFTKEWKRSLRERSVISLIMVDIDFFKPYNDEYGHQAGDNCLKKVVKILIKYSRRETDIIARYGGEEFVIILPATDLKGAMLVAEKIRAGVIDLKIKHRTSRVNDYITISAGVASVVPEIDADQMKLISAADKALYKAKREGRNRIEVYNLSDEINNRFAFEKTDA